MKTEYSRRSLKITKDHNVKFLVGRELINVQNEPPQVKFALQS